LILEIPGSLDTLIRSISVLLNRHR